jgi:hypothetical protein
VHPSGGPKVAVTVVAAVTDTVQLVPVLLVQPVQPPNVDPSAVFAVAVRVTLVP